MIVGWEAAACRPVDGIREGELSGVREAIAIRQRVGGCIGVEGEHGSIEEADGVASACGSLAVLLTTHMANRILTLYTLVDAMAIFGDLECTPWLYLTTM